MAETTYTLEEIKKHNSLSDLWLIYNNDVYDVTKFVEDHPGGEEVLKGTAGKDSTQEFDDVGHSDSAKSKMKQFRIGRVAGAPPRSEEVKKPKATKSAAPVSQVRQQNQGMGMKAPIIFIIVALIAYYLATGQSTA
ncbi:cytochrome b5 A [Heterostelium album PN500]|uniref:Cytochrome b5 A n=1 Tax=Heterostelium pallidum (strain ATCC 26659 / Pp 5 / PN500) TaxID=670386 RepID=D3B7X6_HETP5|nr:cytochrome b5 A [Heterostelium album PN500]EFA82144.1 cytochrome b5 A [Heterostelium album PN500]|eukprot:XP_020434261.1 cytochrome b5 A [Heterostelium album PN500]